VQGLGQFVGYAMNQANMMPDACAEPRDSGLGSRSVTTASDALSLLAIVRGKVLNWYEPAGK
jgi:hypothetical protein